ncbi:MAG: glycosyltransferase family 8 protein [Moraxellaceae bacterium]
MNVGGESFAVVFSSDDRGVQPLGVALFSLLDAAALGTVYKIFILSNGITEANQARLRGLAAGRNVRHSVIFVDVSELEVMRGLPSNARWPIATWARIFIPDLLPDEHGVVLYADIDLLFCRDLTELFHTPLEGKAIGVVLEHVSHEGSHFNERLAIPQTAPGYFNAGVMLMDLEIFRRQDLVRHILAYADANREKLTCLDQDALNGALAENLQRLHPKWNWHDGLTRQLLRRSLHSKSVRGSSLQQAVEAALHPGILHYQGPNKPWHYSYRLERKRYEAAMQASGFGIYPLPGRSFMKWLKRRVYAPIYWLTWLQILRFDRHFRRMQTHG